ncbi:hypothetical protein [Paenarthrobacter aromaticivorans]|uniref:hypothetical protein n=1 Tax=Paenarthrobacter aromaticivorans TaxID=2849150 RepID=UPI003A800D09
MSISDRLRAAAAKVLAGDDSMIAAQQLEGVIIEEYLHEEQTDELLYALSMYSPGSDQPYVDAPELRNLIAATLNDMRHGDASQEA